MTPTILYTLQGTLFEDRDNDGVQDVNEPGIAGATIYLASQSRRAADQEWTTITDQHGFYSFANLQPGSYWLGFALPPAYASPEIRWNNIALDGSSPTLSALLPVVRETSPLYLPMLQR